MAIQKMQLHGGAGDDRIESVQILRGLAAFSVMMLHFTYGNANFQAHLPAIGNIFRYGGHGVYAFFVISGFVIPHAMERANYSFPVGAKEFFLRRIVRLEPPYIVSVMMAVAISYAASQTAGYRGKPFSIDSTMLILHLGYLIPWFDKEWINPAFWTLAIEFQYYIAMIFVAPFLINRSVARQSAFLSVAFLLSLVSSNLALIFVYLPFFALGFIAFLLRHRHLQNGAFVIWLAAFTALGVWNVDLAAAIFGLSTVTLIFVPIYRPVPILTFLGSISYSLYLVHGPVGDRIINLSSRLPSTAWLQFAGLVGAVLASIVVAWLLWRFVEQPSMKMAKLIGRRAAHVVP